MEHISDPPDPVQNPVYISTTCERDWFTDSHVIAWAVLYHEGEHLHSLATGTETFGPLWSPEQVERLVSGLCDRLRAIDWTLAIHTRTWERTSSDSLP